MPKSPERRRLNMKYPRKTLREGILHYFALNVGQAEIAAVGFGLVCPKLPPARRYPLSVSPFWYLNSKPPIGNCSLDEWHPQQLITRTGRILLSKKSLFGCAAKGKASDASKNNFRLIFVRFAVLWNRCCFVNLRQFRTLVSTTFASTGWRRCC
jgi:hypothetical protein